MPQKKLVLENFNLYLTNTSQPCPKRSLLQKMMLHRF